MIITWMYYKKKAILLEKDFLSPYEINGKYQARQYSGLKNQLAKNYAEKKKATLEGVHLEGFDFFSER